VQNPGRGWHQAVPDGPLHDKYAFDRLVLATRPGTEKKAVVGVFRRLTGSALSAELLFASGDG